MTYFLGSVCCMLAGVTAYALKFALEHRAKADEFELYMKHYRRMSEYAYKEAVKERAERIRWEHEAAMRTPPNVN